VLKPLLGISEALGFQVGKAEKVGGFKVVVQRDGGLERVNGGGKIAAVELDAAEDVLGASVTRILGDDGLGKLAGFLDVAGAEPSDGSIDSDIRIGGSEFESLVQFASGFVETGFGDGKIGDLAEAESDGFVEVALGLWQVTSGEGRLGGFETVLEENGGIVGGTSDCSEKRDESKEEYGF